MPNWSHMSDETVHQLQALIRLDTTNPPGREILAAEYLAKLLRAEGLEPVVLESAPGRGNLVVRLRGSGEAAPLLLYGHLDVVGAEPAHWQHPPFAAEIADGYLWGRGAVDMKGAVAQQLVTLLTLKREGVRLKRDVIFAATADEEAGASYGMQWLAQQHPDLVRAEFALSEVGGYNMDFDGKPVYVIQVAEKGVCWLKIRAKGRPGHGSQPHDDNAVVHLARAVDRLATQGLPYHVCPAAAGFLEAVGAAIGGQLGETFKALLAPETGPAALQTFKGHPLYLYLNAILHNTISPTGLAAGYKANVIPGEAEATLDGRPLPGFDTERLLAEIKGVVGDTFEYELIRESPAVQSRHDTPLFAQMAAALKRHDPQTAGVVPNMMTGGTDAKYLVPLGMTAYGFAPVQLPPDLKFMELLHAHNERVPIAGLGWGTQVLYEVVKGHCEG
jgi:acetylornithine deacetylase/succinyl-diaminopimelate desuccinylase-like protein